MRPQFSLATLLVCTAVLAVAIALSMRISVSEEINPPSGYWEYPKDEPTHIIKVRTTATRVRPPTASEVAWRMAWAGPLSVAATLVVLWIARRVNRRPN